METISIGRNVRISAQKARLVADLIRRKSALEAATILYFSCKKSANLIKVVLKSAIYNAKHLYGLNINSIYVSSIYIDKAKSLKRILPRARGRMNRLEKQRCHITIKIKSYYG